MADEVDPAELRQSAKQTSNSTSGRFPARVRIGVVGPCKSGKSTLVRGLQEAGYEAQQIAQEHSFAPSMWQQIDPPDVLIYLHCRYKSTVARGLNWMRIEYEDQLPRLAHARRNADLEIETDELKPDEVLAKTILFLNTNPK
jgi:ATPase subunit of ABC transporter with duplicated ATPase domains